MNVVIKKFQKECKKMEQIEHIKKYTNAQRKLKTDYGEKSNISICGWFGYNNKDV